MEDDFKALTSATIPFRPATLNKPGNLDYGIAIPIALFQWLNWIIISGNKILVKSSSNGGAWSGWNEFVRNSDLSKFVYDPTVYIREIKHSIDSGQRYITFKSADNRIYRVKADEVVES